MKSNEFTTRPTTEIRTADLKALLLASCLLTENDVKEVYKDPSLLSRPTIRMAAVQVPEVIGDDYLEVIDEEGTSWLTEVNPVRGIAELDEAFSV